MSTEEDEAADIMCCASCGIAAVDNVKLKKCTCGLVKYCSIACQKNHRSKHKKMCKKRLAELRDRDLFEQRHATHLGDCPLCCLPLPVHVSECTFMGCCSKRICNGCNYANQIREKKQGLHHAKCAFCRETAPTSFEESRKRCMERVKKNDPVAMLEMGLWSYREEGDYKTALEYLTKSAELGDAEAHNQLACMYEKGDGVEKDMKKAVYHMEEAALGGHPMARYNLGIQEWNNGSFERAAKHFIIAANLGFHDSLKELRELYADGHASKEDYADALRAYQVAVDAKKSSQREAADTYYKALDAAQ